MSYPGLRERSAGRLGLVGAVNHDLVANPVNLATAQIGGLRDHGGPKIAHPRLWLVFVNDWWGDWKQSEAFARDLMEAGYLEPLHELGYGYQGGARYGGALQVRESLSAPLTDSDVRRFLDKWARAGEIPTPGADELFATIWPDSVSIVFDGEQQGSCQTWCGYHWNMTAPAGGPLYYTVQTSTECGPCNGGIPAFEAFTMVLAHEVAEAVTDPEGTGWYRDSDGSENADQVAWNQLQYGPWRPQGYATNERGNTIGTYTPVSVPQPPPPTDLAQRLLDAVRAEAAKLQAAYDANHHATSLKWQAKGAAAVEAAAEAEYVK